MTATPTTLDGRSVRLCVATPTHDARVHAEHATTVESIREWCTHHGADYIRLILSGSQLAKMRCDLVVRALAHQATHILFLDEDIALPGHGRAVAQMLGTMIEGYELVSAACMVRPALGTSSGHGIVGASIPAALAGLRAEPFRWASSVLTPEGRIVGLAPIGRDQITGPMLAPEGACLLLGCGALLIDARAFDRFERNEHPFRFAEGLGEDHWFSWQVQKRGGKAAIDPRVTTVHYGSTGWIWEGQAER